MDHILVQVAVLEAQQDWHRGVQRQNNGRFKVGLIDRVYRLAKAEVGDYVHGHAPKRMADMYGLAFGRIALESSTQGIDLIRLLSAGQPL